MEQTVGSEWHYQTVIPKHKLIIMHPGKLQVRRYSKERSLLHILQVINSLFNKISTLIDWHST